MPRSILLDTSLLVLLIVGQTDRSLITKHKNLNNYDEDGYNLLLETVSKYAEILLTPNTLTETSSLLRQIGSPDRERLTHTLQQFINAHPENYIDSREAAKEPHFIRLGLTDAVLLKASKNDVLLLSADHRLCDAAGRHGLDALNFAHIYDMRFG